MFIVIKQYKNGHYSPVANPMVHLSEGDAEHEALRLATTYPDQSFVVFKAISRAQSAPQPVTLTKL